MLEKEGIARYGYTSYISDESFKTQKKLYDAVSEQIQGLTDNEYLLICNEHLKMFYKSAKTHKILKLLNEMSNFLNYSFVGLDTVLNNEKSNWFYKNSTIIRNQYKSVKNQIVENIPTDFSWVNLWDKESSESKTISSNHFDNSITLDFESFTKVEDFNLNAEEMISFFDDWKWLNSIGDRVQRIKNYNSNIEGLQEDIKYEREYISDCINNAENERKDIVSNESIFKDRMVRTCMVSSSD